MRCLKTTLMSGIKRENKEEAFYVCVLQRLLSRTSPLTFETFNLSNIKTWRPLTACYVISLWICSAFFELSDFVTTATMETSKTCRESKGSVFYGDKDPNLKIYSLQLNSRIPHHLFASHWIGITAIAIYLVLQSTAKYVNEVVRQWQGILQLLYSCQRGRFDDARKLKATKYN